jgi:hypothetical protein
MSHFLNWSVNAYRVILLGYPENLQRDFGPEMIEAFSYDLASECARCGIKGAVRIWRIALYEFLQLGLPGYLLKPSVAVPAISAMGTVFSLSFMLLLTLRSDHGMVRHWGGSIIAEAGLAVLLPALISALMSFVAVHKRKSETFLSLGLG